MATYLFLLAILLDISAIFIYALYPIFKKDYEFLKQDIFNILDLRQSIFVVSLLSLLRLSVFSYITYWTRSQHGTRCLVCLAITYESAMVTIFSLQLYLWHNNPDCFLSFHLFPWRASYLNIMIGISLTSCLLEIICILRLNKERLGPDDEILLKEILHSSETRQTQWLEKWTNLTKHFVKQSDTAFDSILRLYAHTTGSMEQLSHLQEQDPQEFVFYIPQMCSFLLLGAFKQSAQLCMILLNQCSMSHVFAHRMVWYLKAFCKTKGAFSSVEQEQGILALIAEVEMRGRIPAIRFSQTIDKKENRKNSLNENSSIYEERLLPVKDDDYQTFNKSEITSLLDNKSFLQEQQEQEQKEPFNLEMLFINELTQLSSDLSNVSFEERDAKLRESLEKLESKYFPSNALYLPVGNSFHHIRHLHASESFTFSTKKRVPYFLCVEIVDDISLIPTSQNRGFGGFSYTMRFGSKEFRLSLFNHSNEENKYPRNRKVNDAPVYLNPQNNDDLNQGNLGFWSNDSKKEKEQSISSPNSNPFFSKPFSSSMPDASKVISDLIGSFAGFSPRKETSSSSSDLRSTIGDFRSESVLDDKNFVHSKRFRRNSAEIMLNSNRQERIIDIEQSIPLKSSSPDQLTPKLSREDSTDAYLMSQYDDDIQYELDDSGIHSNDHSGECIVKPVVFKEKWIEKEARIRCSSSYGHLPGWRLLPVIIKSNDDLRQEQFALQLIKQFSNVFKEAKLPVWIRSYDVIATSPTAGIVEAIPDTISIDSLKRHDTCYTTLLNFFIRRFGHQSSSAFKKARHNFVSSMAAYSIVCYLLQIKDRHNGNILLDSEGHIIHIDFGFMLSNYPGNMYFERAPFKLTADFVELMGGPRSATFRRFRSLCVRTFLVARKHRHHITLLVEMMLNGNEDLPCFAGDPRGTVSKLVSRFKPEYNTSTCENFVHDLIDMSLDNWRTRWYDKYQRWCVGIF